MKILLDTHAFLWSISGENLSQPAQEAFLNSDNQLYLSAASYWEICVKLSIGKLGLAEGWEQAFDRELLANNIGWLPIEKGHCQLMAKLPWIHRDPFDRMLAAQSQLEGLPLVTSDAAFTQFEIEVLW